MRVCCCLAGREQELHKTVIIPFSSLLLWIFLTGLEAASTVTAEGQTRTTSEPGLVICLQKQRCSWRAGTYPLPAKKLPRFSGFCFIFSWTLNYSQFPSCKFTSRWWLQWIKYLCLKACGGLSSPFSVQLLQLGRGGTETQSLPPHCLPAPSADTTQVWVSVLLSVHLLHLLLHADTWAEAEPGTREVCRSVQIWFSRESKSFPPNHRVCS